MILLIGGAQSRHFLDLLIDDLLCLLRKLQFLQSLSEILNFLIWTTSATEASKSIHEIFESALVAPRRYLGDDGGIDIRVVVAALFVKIIILLPDLINLDIELIYDFADTSLQVVTF